MGDVVLGRDPSGNPDLPTVRRPDAVAVVDVADTREQRARVVSGRQQQPLSPRIVSAPTDRSLEPSSQLVGVIERLWVVDEPSIRLDRRVGQSPVEGNPVHSGEQRPIAEDGADVQELGECTVPNRRSVEERSDRRCVGPEHATPETSV